ncbi:L-fucose kinase-like isoform X1 [Mizuhopecten yessoensis]|uniref:L-fucose kinase-like isoform X1 n=1 Tax=Mizuhopecten yessoensis TaxID=6573 RepID=UPI000B45A868|nr:L-fucose kinase-like isoform X1 [Mizuhopecten yessoensis]
MAERVKWTAIVLTCANRQWASTLQTELQIRQAKGQIDKDVLLLTVEDPKSSVGSGGATINALLTVTEYLSAQRGYSIINPDVLQEAKVLILHCGRNYPYEPCGRAFITLPASLTSPEYDGMTTNLDLLLKNLTEKLAVKSPPGIWVSSTDMILSIPENAAIPWTNSDVCVITVPSTPKYCRNHGVYKINTEGYVTDILYQRDLGGLECCERPDGTVPVVCSVIYLSHAVTEALLSFHVKPPLDACTYMGVDSGQPPIQLSLFFDVMLPMTSDVNEKEFVSGGRSGVKGQAHVPGSEDMIKTMRSARQILWRELHNFKIWACMVERGEFRYLVSCPLDHEAILLDCPYKNNFHNSEITWQDVNHSLVQDKCKVEDDAILINSILSDKVVVSSKSIVSDCHLGGRMDVGRGCLITGLSVETQLKTNLKKTVKIGDYTVVQCFRIYLSTLGKTVHVLTTHGKFDRVEAPMYKSTTTFCNNPWVVFLNLTGIIKEDLWGPDMDNDNQNVLNARLFPVFHSSEELSLEDISWLHGELEDNDQSIVRRWRSSWRLSLNDILSCVNMEEELRWKKTLFYNVSKNHIRCDLLQSSHHGFRSIYNSAHIEGFSQEILLTLDQVAKECQGSPGIAARTLANIADVLGCMAATKGGLRSGPAANKSWARAFHKLEKGDLVGGVDALAKIRESWLGRPDLLTRAARHYEGAASILIRQAVMTAKKNFKLELCEAPDIGKWVTAECPARIDVAGGWSDTPPITYEHGGAVTTIALKINGKKPVGSKARRIREPKIVMVLYGFNQEDTHVVCEELSHLENYYQPHSPGALLKAAIVCADVINIDSDLTLKEQLLQNYGGGFEIHSWSNLPQGSGMGTSSILAGAVMAALLRASGKSCDRKGLIHAVLYLEQLLTTGGGWQDQVGGIMGGIRIGLSDAKLPLSVDAIDLKPSEDVIKAISERIILIYTGKTRLARNVLQEVVRNWYARNPQIVETEDSLVRLAQECAHAFIDAPTDFEKVGDCLKRYWELKKVMAPGCETEVVASLMSVLQPHVHGMCMAGAGGGGFMYAIAKDNVQRDVIKEVLKNAKIFQQEEGAKGSVIYDACVDTDGLQVTVEE